jgi:hypothetical protein
MIRLSVLLALLGAGLIACGLPGQTVMKPDALSPTLAPMVYKEEGGLVLITVSVNATRFHEDDPFIPLEVWLANKGIEPNLRIGRESFYLMDTFGRRYGVAGFEEVRRLQRGLSQDMNITFAGPNANAYKFKQAYRYVPTTFFPTAGRGVLHDRAELPRFAYMADLLYFPRPEGELLGGIFELHLTAKELPEDVFVVFEVPR